MNNSNGNNNDNSTLMRIILSLRSLVRFLNSTLENKFHITDTHVIFSLFHRVTVQSSSPPPVGGRVVKPVMAVDYSQLLGGRIHLWMNFFKT